MDLMLPIIYERIVASDLKRPVSKTLPGESVDHVWVADACPIMMKRPPFFKVFLALVLSLSWQIR
jgi:hypothetical protein